MSEAMKPSSGAAYSRREGWSTVYVFVRIGGGLIQEVAACWPTNNGQDEQQANADLVTDAFNTLHTTGMTPMQLVERVKELEDALERISSIEDQMYGADWQEIEKARDIARAALAKSQGENT